MAKYGRKTKIFDGKKYYMRGFRDTKKEAETLKRRLSNTYSVRITKTSSPKGYAIWTNPDWK